MLTNRLQQIKNNIQKDGLRTQSDTELLRILNWMDKVESLIASSPDLDDSQLILEMIVKPGSNTCDACGRNIK